MGSSLIATPNRYLLAQKHVIRRIAEIVEISRPVFAQLILLPNLPKSYALQSIGILDIP